MNKRHSILVHCSNPEMGGAERSVLTGIPKWKHKGHEVSFVVPATGGITRILDVEGVPYKIHQWPAWVDWFTQHQIWWQWPAFMLWPLGIVSLYAYLSKLSALFSKHDVLYSSGLKSHCMFLLLAPFHSSRMVFNIRDFIEPVAFRRFFSLAASTFRIRVEANSRAVAKDYPNASVNYPLVKLARDPEDRRRKDGVLTIMHAAFFAPYKGQDVFLHYARRILDAGMRAEFWLAGGVIYPGARYRRYRQKLMRLARELDLEQKVTWWGKVDDLQPLLEQTHVVLHCTRDPEPFGRIVMEGLLCGCRVLCHRRSGVCEVTVEQSITDTGIDLGIEFNKEHVFVALRG
ncbi:glycosyltransferase family 4 protein [Fibrobacterota bacterium]